MVFLWFSYLPEGIAPPTRWNIDPSSWCWPIRSGAAIGSDGTSDPCRGVAGLPRRLRRGTTGVFWWVGNRATPPEKRGSLPMYMVLSCFIMFYHVLSETSYAATHYSKSVGWSLFCSCFQWPFWGFVANFQYHQIPSGRRRLLRLLWWWEGRQGQQGQQGWGALDWEIWNCLEYVGVHKSGETHLSNCWTDYCKVVPHS